MAILKILLIGIFAITFFGLFNTASAHTLSSGDGSMSTFNTDRPNFVTTTLKDVPCGVSGWDLDGTDLGGDSPDGDGICQDWEIETQGSQGLNIHFRSGGTDYVYTYLCTAGNGPDPICPLKNKKDVYLELDWMSDTTTPNSHVPLAGVLTHVKNVFNTLGNNNLHVQMGEYPASATSSRQGDIKWHTNLLQTNYDSSIPGFYRVKQYQFGTVDDRWPTGDPAKPAETASWVAGPYQNAEVQQRLTAKFNVFHYALIINKRAEAPTSLGWAEIWGNDHVWSLGSAPTPMGSVGQQKAVFLHELGHNFKLDHGGISSPPNSLPDSISNKPNYFSVMNPEFQFVYPDGKDLCRPLDLSNKALNNLDENSLSEPTGVSSADGAGYLYPPAPYCTKSWPAPGAGNALNASLDASAGVVEVGGTQRFFWYKTPTSQNLYGFDRVQQPVNWDNDGGASKDTEADVEQDINVDAVPPPPADPTPAMHNSNSDWSNLIFDFGPSSFSSPPVTEEGFQNSHEGCDYVPEEIILQDSFTVGCREITSDDIRKNRVEAIELVINSTKSSAETGSSDTSLLDSLNLIKSHVQKDELKDVIKELIKLKKSEHGNKIKGDLYNLLAGFGESYVMGTKVKSEECKKGFDQIISFRNGNFACVKPKTVEQLEKTGWGFQLEQYKSDLKKMS